MLFWILLTGCMGEDRSCTSLRPDHETLEGAEELDQLDELHDIEEFQFQKSLRRSSLATTPILLLFNAVRETFRRDGVILI